MPMTDETNNKKTITYADSGVDIKAGEKSVEIIKEMVASTFNSQVLQGLGSFGGFFEPDFGGISKPVLISSTDSVGTKLKISFMTNRHDTIGECLVNHCVNDILVHGAKPLFFLDYLGLNKVNPDTVAEIVSGISRACKKSGAALVGGETAELTDLYQPGEYDLAGFIVGVVDKEKIINGSAIQEGDICLGLKSDGLHTNGYTLARKVLFDIGKLDVNDMVDELGETVADAMLRVHRCYAPIILPLLEKFPTDAINGMAHITGGGIEGNLKRILPDSCLAEVSKSSWEVPALFSYLQKLGNIDREDIYRSFNMGIGYILVVNPNDAEEISEFLVKQGEEVVCLGSIKAKENSEDSVILTD